MTQVVFNHRHVQDVARRCVGFGFVIGISIGFTCGSVFMASMWAWSR